MGPEESNETFVVGRSQEKKQDRATVADPGGAEVHQCQVSTNL